jgi:hypothetical protein
MPVRVGVSVRLGGRFVPPPAPAAFGTLGGSMFRLRFDIFGDGPTAFGFPFVPGAPPPTAEPGEGAIEGEAYITGPCPGPGPLGGCPPGACVGPGRGPPFPFTMDIAAPLGRGCPLGPIGTIPLGIPPGRSGPASRGGMPIDAAAAYLCTFC